MRRMLIAVAALAVSLTGCYVESEEERAKGSKDVSDSYDLTKECESDWSLGCLAGFVIPGSTIKVQGQSFINADQLDINFHQVLSFPQDEAEATYQVELAKPLDTSNFADGFSVRLSSNKAMKTRTVGKDGRFIFDYLPEGEYSVELSKRVDFTIRKLTSCANPQEELTEACTSEEVKQYCGLLSGVSNVRIRRNEQLIKTFPTFDFYVMGENCQSSGQGNAIDF